MEHKTIDVKAMLVSTLKICIGLFVTGVGTAMMYLVNWGSAPAATIGDGVHVTFGLSYGVAGIVANVVFLAVLLILDRKLISVGTVLATFFLGIFIDVGLVVVSPLHIDAAPTALKAVYLVLGCVITAVGLGYYVGVNFGIGAIDGLSVALNKKTKLPFSVCRWGVDILIMLAGVALGAAWGVGTVVSIVVTGPIMGFVIKRMNRPKGEAKAGV